MKTICAAVLVSALSLSSSAASAQERRLEKASGACYFTTGVLWPNDSRYMDPLPKATLEDLSARARKGAQTELGAQELAYFKVRPGLPAAGFTGSRKVDTGALASINFVADEASGEYFSLRFSSESARLFAVCADTASLSLLSGLEPDAAHEVLDDSRLAIYKDIALSYFRVSRPDPELLAMADVAVDPDAPRLSAEQAAALERLSLRAFDYKAPDGASFAVLEFGRFDEFTSDFEQGAVLLSQNGKVAKYVPCDARLVQVFAISGAPVLQFMHCKSGTDACEESLVLYTMGGWQTVPL